MSSILALGAAAVFGVADFLGGRASSRSPVMTVTMIANIVGGALACALAAVVATSWSVEAVVWGGVGECAGLVGLLLLYHGLATGPNRLVSPVSAVVAAVVPVAVGLAIGERPGSFAAIGIALTPMAVWMIADGAWKLAEDRRSLTIAIGAGLGFGAFFACLGQTPDDAGAAPLVAARAVSVAILIGIAFAQRKPHATTSWAILLPASAVGTLDMTANGLFLWAVQDGDLAITGALVSLFPTTTIALAVIVLHEHIRPRQIAGIATALLAAALLS